MPGTPLPPVSDPKVRALEPNALHAYRICLTSERDLATTKDVRFGRLLGYLLLCSPTWHVVCNEIAHCIRSYEATSELPQLGAFFECHFILAFKKFKGRASALTSHPMSPSFDGTRSQMIKEIKETPNNHTSAKEQALLRDNYRCVITDMLHEDAPSDVAAACDPNIYRTTTECAHIIPEATHFGVEPKEADNRMLAYSASILAILERFHTNISSFSGEKVHSLTNVMTMDMVLRHAFDRLQLYFETTEVPHRYKVKTYNKYNLNQHKEVIFSTPDTERLPLPSPDLLALRAVCCQVAHLSGSTEHIEQVFRDAAEMGVLPNNGASKDLLQYMLLPLAVSYTAIRR